MTRAAGFAAWSFRMAARAWASAEAVTVQVFTTTTSADVESDAAVQPPSSSWRSIAAPSACVARQPNCWIWKVFINSKLTKARIEHRDHKVRTENAEQMK